MRAYVGQSALNMLRGWKCVMILLGMRCLPSPRAQSQVSSCCEEATQESHD
jgi:hypothetical protein